MAEHLTRRELKTDQFALTAEHTAEFLGMHRRQALQVGGLVLLAAILGVGGYFWWDHARSVRETKLSEAMQIADEPVSAVVSAQQTGPSFPSQAAKDAAETKAFSEIAGQYHGSREGVAAEFTLAGIAVSAGRNDEARKRFQSVADAGNKEFASMAKLSLAQLDFAENRPADGEKLLHDLIDHPTAVVSSAQATLTLARLIAPTRPKEARALINPLVKDQGETGQMANAALSEISAK